MIKKLLLLQDSFRRADKHKPFHMRPVNVSVIVKKETSAQDSGTTKTHPKEEDTILSSIGDLLPHSYREQSKRVLT